MTDTRSSPSRRYLALWFPFLPADRLRRRSPAASARRGEIRGEIRGATRAEERGAGLQEAPQQAPLVFVEKQRGALRLAAVDARAVTLGLCCGLTLADARARIPDLVAIDNDPEADARLLERLADDCDRWTPLVALAPPDALLLDITGCAHLFGGEPAMRARLRRHVEGLGFSVRLAGGGTPEAALALARFGEGIAGSQDSEAAAVRALPVAALGLDAEALTGLVRAGFRRLGDLVRFADAGMPDEGVNGLADEPEGDDGTPVPAVRPGLSSTAPLTARFGAEMTSRLRRLLGAEDIRITPRRPLPACIAERRFAEPVARTEDIEGTIERLVGQVGKILEERGEGLRLLEASFFRTDGAVRRITVETAGPVRDPQAILRLCRERIEALADPLDPGFGFDLVRLAVLRAEPRLARQDGLDGDEAGGEGAGGEEVSELVGRLVARFGRERVLHFETRDTHDPARADHLVPVLEQRPVPAPAGSFAEPEPGEPPSRPLHLFDRPQPIETLAEVPDGPPIRFRWRRVLHEVTKAEGPERIAAEWWRADAAAPTRDYFRIEDAQGRRFWVYREGLYGRETDAPRWFLHGVFA